MGEAGRDAEDGSRIQAPEPRRPRGPRPRVLYT